MTARDCPSPITADDVQISEREYKFLPEWNTMDWFIPRVAREINARGQSVRAASSPRPCGPSTRADRTPVKAPRASRLSWARTVSPKSVLERDLKSRGISKARLRPVKVADSDDSASARRSPTEIALSRDLIPSYALGF